MNYASRKLNICLAPHFHAVVVVANRFENMSFESNRKQLNGIASTNENIADGCAV